MKSGKYFVISADPGKHEYFTEGEAKDRLNLEVEDGETYFVKCKIGMGIMAGRANLSPSDRGTFAGKAKGLTMWKGPKDDGKVLIHGHVHGLWQVNGRQVRLITMQASLDF